MECVVCGGLREYSNLDGSLKPCGRCFRARYPVFTKLWTALWLVVIFALPVLGILALIYQWLEPFLGLFQSRSPIGSG